MRKNVKPSVEGATILDPSRGRPLPPEGANVEWTPYWASLEIRKDVLVTDEINEGKAAPEPLAEPVPEPEEPALQPEEPEAGAEPDPVAPITRALRRQK